MYFSDESLEEFNMTNDDMKYANVRNTNTIRDDRECWALGSFVGEEYYNSGRDENNSVCGSDKNI